MRLYSSFRGRHVLATLTNGDVLDGQLHRAGRDGIVLASPRVQNKNPGAWGEDSWIELSGAVVIPTHSIVTVQIEAPHGV